MMSNSEEGKKDTQMKEIKDLRKEFLNVLQKSESVEYCKIETIEGSRVVKKRGRLCLRL
jgi:hypothetical protein